MKKILLSLMLIAAFASMNTAKAQGGANSCVLVIENVVVTKTAGPTATDGGCQYTFDASFDILSNAGFEYLYFHSWTAGAGGGYGSGSFDCTKNGAQNPPTASRLGISLSQSGVSFLDFGLIDLKDVVFSSDPLNPTNITANIAQVYQNDPTVPLNFAGATATVYNTATSSHYEIKNITVILAGACGPFTVITDVWGSNAAATSPMAHCYLCGLSQTFNNPSLSLTKNCSASPFTYTLGLTTTGGPTLHAVYKLYADYNFDGVKQPEAGDPLIYTSDPFDLPPNATTTFGPLPLPWPWCCIDDWAQAGIYAEVVIQEFGNSVGSQIADVICATLPVKLTSFTATRNRSLVELKWETAQEENSKGFYVERKLSNGGWQSVTFVETKAIRGNSSLPLTYEYTDLNDSKGISQYRLRQVDIDGKQAFSLIRAVRGQGQKGKTIIYPNPSGDGKVNIVFENVNSSRDVSLMDVSGKTLKQWKGVTNNNIQIDNLNAGFYSVRIVNNETGEHTVEKFIVNKR